MVSSFAMPGGTFQYGLNTTCVISSAKIGVLLSGAPTTTRMSMNRLAVFDRLETEVGHVHEEVARSGIAIGQPAPALEVELDRANALFDGDIQRADGRRIDDAVGLDAMPLFEPLHRVDDGVVENRTRIFFVRRIEIAFDRQPLPQRRHDRPIAGAA